jgi:hypothetical protein
MNFGMRRSELSRQARDRWPAEASSLSRDPAQQALRPSTHMIFSVADWTPSRQRTLIAAVAVPDGSVPNRMARSA